MSKPDPPTPPNPVATAAAQTGTNVTTGIANAWLNNTNQVTPDGSLTYSAPTMQTLTDPSTGVSYQIPQFTATQTLSPTGQQLKDINNQTKLNLANMGQQQSSSISNLLSKPMDFSGAPQAGSSAGLKGVPQALTSFDAGGPITKTYGPEDNFSADRQRVEDSLMARLNPQLNQQQDKIAQQLADQGIRYGSAAYNNAFTPFNQQANDARFAAINQAGTEQQRMNDMAAQLAAFQNQAQGQQFTQNAALGTFANAGLAQQLGQQQSIFNADQAGRNTWMQEQYAQRNQPINEITSLMSGSQINQPNFVNTPGSQIATTDFAGITNQNFQNQMGVYNAQNQNYQQLMGGLLGLGGQAIKASDRRVKENIEPVGEVPMASVFSDSKELPIYRYSYKGDPSSARHVGPMAQDVEKIDRGAVKNIGGVKHIDTQRVMGGILRAA
jgi:hypothetical protein